MGVTAIKKRCPRASIIGIGCSVFSLGTEASPTALAADALRDALADSGLQRSDIDGLAMHYGTPLGIDYDRVANAFGLDVRYVSQNMVNGRFISTALQHAAMAVDAGLASVVACVTTVGFTRSRQRKAGGPGPEAMREEGGTHGEAPAYGMSFPAAGAALAAQSYMHRYGVGPEQLAQVAISTRAHASRNPTAIMRNLITVDDYLAAPMIVDPLRLLDCCLVSDGAVVVLVGAPDRAADLRQAPVDIVGMQGLRAGRQEFIFAPPGLGIFTQDAARGADWPAETEVFQSAGLDRSDMQGFYSYDAFSPLVLYALERFGYCPIGEAADFIADGRTAPGGALPVNTSGGLLSEAHVAGWNSVVEMVRQLRGTAGARQIGGARHLQWATAWGDSVILAAR